MPSSIPLGDLRREYAPHPLRNRRGHRAGPAPGLVHPGRGGRGLRGRVGRYCGVAHAVGVGNGTDAIHLALRAAGIGPGDEVIVPALTAAFTALAVSMAGATPVFADIDPERYTLDPAAFEAAITPRTAAVIPVHLYGCPADMAPHPGDRPAARVCWCWRTRPRPTAPATRASALADWATWPPLASTPARTWAPMATRGPSSPTTPSWPKRSGCCATAASGSTYQHELLGTNSRLDEIQAAILRAKLPPPRRLEPAAAGAGGPLRRRPARLRRSGAARCARATWSTSITCTWCALPAGMRCVTIWPGPGSRPASTIPRASTVQAAYAHLGYEQGSCPNAESAAAEILSLPIFPQLSDYEVAQVDPTGPVLFCDEVVLASLPHRSWEVGDRDSDFLGGTCGRHLQ